MEVSFTTGEVAVITALLGAVVSALTVVFRLLVAEKTDRIEFLERELEKAQQREAALWETARYSAQLVERSTQVAGEAMTVVKARRGAS